MEYGSFFAVCAGRFFVIKIPFAKIVAKGIYNG